MMEQHLVDVLIEQRNKLANELAVALARVRDLEGQVVKLTARIEEAAEGE